MEPYPPTWDMCETGLDSRDGTAGPGGRRPAHPARKTHGSRGERSRNAGRGSFSFSFSRNTLTISIKMAPTPENLGPMQALAVSEFLHSHLRRMAVEDPAGALLHVIGLEPELGTEFCVVKISEILKQGWAAVEAAVAGYHPLSTATIQGSTRVVAKLLELGANPNIRKCYGKPPLVIACTYKHLDIVRLLLRHGADVNRADLSKQTALQFSAGAQPEEKALELVSLLLGTPGINVNSRDIDGRRPIHSAVAHDNSRVVKLLVDAGSELECILQPEGK